MGVFKKFEVYVLKELTVHIIPAEDMAKIASGAVFVSFEHQSTRYLLTVTHPLIPERQFVISSVLRGPETLTIGGIDCAFRVWVSEPKRMVFECHSKWEEILPSDIRCGKVVY